MNPPQILQVDPSGLRLPPSRIDGADPHKFQRQLAKFGKSTAGMPPVIVFRATDGELIIYDGVTRATRVAKLLPGHPVPVEVIGSVRSLGAKLPTIKEKLP